jgi:hypothetical protein
VGRSYPISKFGEQANAAVSDIGNAEEGWSGTMLPARMAGAVQRQADWSFPLRLEDAQELLKVLDALIDLAFFIHGVIRLELMGGDEAVGLA